MCTAAWFRWERMPNPRNGSTASYGKVLLARAEEIARGAGFRRLAIMSGIGVRPYYRRQGYERRGPYMIRELS